jgi:hypothetical protein
MVQCRKGLSFPFESGDSFGISSKCLGEDLDRYVPIELAIAGEVDLL